jgi:hypothetical protein
MPIGNSYGARRFNTLVTLTWADAVADDYGHASFDKPVDVMEVYASVSQMSASKAMLTFQQADVVGVEIELRNPHKAFNGIRYNGHDVHFSQPLELERGRILRISGYYQQDNPQIV